MTRARSFRQSMAWLHTWSGLVVGWVLFAVFVTGTASYYRGEISRWMRPELRDAAADPAAAATLAGDFLRRTMPDALGWFVRLPGADQPATEVYWWKAPGGPYHHALLDAETGHRSGARATEGGDFLYRFHFELHLPVLWGRWIVSVCAMILLVALISGIVTHRRIFADFFTFRRDRSAQRGWLDAHNVAGVLALPFHLMIVYTGLVTLAPMLMPWTVAAAYRQDAHRYLVEAGVMPETGPAAAGGPGTLPPLGAFVARATAEGGAAPMSLSVTDPAEAGSAVTAIFAPPRGLADLNPQIVYAGETGIATARTGEAGAATRTGAVMIGLHQATFAAAPLRLLFFLCGTMGAVVIATGLVLWTVARAPKGAEPAGLGLRLVRVLNVGTVAGLPAGIAGYFLANRLLPIGPAERADWEIGVFFGAWVLTAVAAALVPRPRAWPVGLGLAATAFLAIPPVDVLTIGETRFLGFDAAMLALGLLLTLGSRLSIRPPARLRRTPALPGAARA